VAQLIIVAFGVQFRDSDWPDTEKLLKANCDAKAGAVDTFTFPKGAGAKATFEIQVVFALADFAKAVDTPDAVVVYVGHSRYGQGPAFAPAGTGQTPDAKAFPVNPWGVHYRMGYEATVTDCIGDLVHHSVMPVEFDLTTTPSSAFLDKGLKAAATNAQAQAKAMKKQTKKPTIAAVCAIADSWREFDSCYATLAKTPTSRGDTPLSGRHYYKDERGKEFKTAVTVGSVDLDKSKLPGKLLFMASCSSHPHFFEALDRRRAAVKSACKFMLTGEVCYVNLATPFLQLVLVRKIDPTTEKGMKVIASKLNGVDRSGGVGLY